MPVKINRTNERKAQMIKALESCYGIVTDACQIVGISRVTHYEWAKEDSDYAKAAEETRSRLIDLAERKLTDNIKEGKEASIMFALKCLAKERGYLEKAQIEVGMIDPTKPLKIIFGSE